MKMKTIGKERQPAKQVFNHCTDTAQSKSQPANTVKSRQILKEDIPPSGEDSSKMHTQGAEDTKCSAHANPKTSGQFNSIQNAHAIPSANDFERRNSRSQHFAVNKTSHGNYIWKGKENSHLVKQMSRRNMRRVQTHGANQSTYNYVERKVTMTKMNVMAEHNSYSGEGLLPNPTVSSLRLNTAVHFAKDISNKDPVRHKKYVDSSQWNAWQRPNRMRFPRSSLSHRMRRWETERYEKSEMQPNNSLMDRNNSTNIKGPMAYGSRVVELHAKPVFSHKGLLPVPFQHHHYRSREAAGRPMIKNQHIVNNSSYFLVSCPATSACGQPSMPYPGNFQVPIHGWFQQYNWMNRTVVYPDAACHFIPFYSRSKVRNEYKIKNSITPRVNAKKWIPVGLKGTQKGTTGSISSCNLLPNNSLFLSKEVSDRNLKGNEVTLNGSVALRVSNTSLVSGNKRTSDESEARKCEIMGAAKEVYFVKCTDDDITHHKKGEDSSQYMINVIGSHIIEAVDAAYKVQLASESFECALGCPVAEFEKFLPAAAPVIGSLNGEEKCAVCLDSQPSPTVLCKHQIPNISLNAVWNWYEKPGNYGLEIKVESSRDLKGLLTGPVSFRAYFVPFLSSVQLFGYRNPSSCCRRNEKPIEVEIQEQVIHSFEEPIILPKAFSCWSDSELVFEFFESEQPHQRKPLHLKILELIDGGKFDFQVFGDPSKLESLRLHDLHPASWFSVAWYPIYQIPDGMFRASFLTYHSLGYLVQRGVSDDSLNKKACYIVPPVVGLQSYNTQGECWFDTKVPLKSSLKESMLLNSSGILSEQINTLEKNALLFSRGCVYKNGMKVSNRQPDYEFFVSRKN